MRRRTALLLFLMTAFAPVARADDVRPATFDVRETAPGQFEVRWQTPMRGRSRLRAHPVLPPEAVVEDRSGEAVGDSWIERFRFTLPGGLLGKTLGVAGLGPSSRNAIARIRLLDGTRHHAVLGGSHPTTLVEAPAHVLAAPWTIRVQRAFLDGAQHARTHSAHALLVIALVLLGGTRAWGLTLALFLFCDLLGAFLPGTLGADAGFAEALSALVAALAARAVLLGRGPLPAVLVATAGLVHGLTLPSDALPMPARVAYALGVDAVHLVLGALALLLATVALPRLRVPVAWTIGAVAIAVAVVAAVQAPPRVASVPTAPLALDLGGPDVGAGAAPSAQGLQSDVEIYLDVGVFETRIEVLGRFGTLAAWLDGQETHGERLSVARQPALLTALERALEGKLGVRLDGAPATADARRRAFATQDATGTYLREEPVDEDLTSSLIGFAFSFATPEIPSRVEVRLADVPPGLETLRARVLDPEVSREVEVPSDEPVLVWRNELTQEPLPAIEALRLEAPPRLLPIAALVALFLGLAAALGRLRAGQPALAIGVLRLGLAASVLAAPLLAIDIGSAAETGTAPTPTAGRRIVRVLLDNLYRSFNVREEGAVYERLAASLTDDSRADAYLQNRRALAVARVGGARTHVDAVELLEVAGLEPLEGGGFRVDATWTVAGSVTHFGHRHLRQNLYRARLDVVGRDGAWKIATFEIRDLERRR